MAEAQDVELAVSENQLVEIMLFCKSVILLDVAGTA